MKQEKQEEKMNPTLTKLLERGIPVRRAEFQSAVNNSDGTPENYFSIDSAMKSRHVTMWWINGDGLLCCHKDEYFLVPSANVRFVRFE